jgi:transglutaminase-like putative cysteine protease
MKLRGKTIFDYQVAEPTPVQMMLRPRREAKQIVLQETFQISPSVSYTEYTDQYGNHCQRAILPIGYVNITTEVEAIVTPFEPPTKPLPHYVSVELLPDEVMQYLLPSRYAQSDVPKIYQLANEIVKNLAPGYEQVAAIRNWVHHNVRYEYNTTNANTTALDTINERIGVCRDFTHLAVALCRSLCIPARITVGYLDQLKYMDLHAWFEAYLSDGWHTFDAVQEQTHGSRVVLGYGRDAADVAMITQFNNAQLTFMKVTVETQHEEMVHSF